VRIAIVGYGKMGRLVEQLAVERGIKVGAKVDIGDDPVTIDNVDVAIDFTMPGAVIGNVERIAARGINMVVGTTGWQEQMPRVKEIVAERNIGLVWSPNFSIGVNAFFRIVETASRLLNDYEAWAWEIHHSAKKDAPSGTLLKLVEEMKRAGYTGKVDVASNRAGKIPGTHEIGFDSAADTITLRHTARTREGFALGALKAAEWIVGKKGFHEFSEIL
jgi:4-hydroxy-tetrahydrodipicolinate reductase